MIRRFLQICIGMLMVLAPAAPTLAQNVIIQSVTVVNLGKVVSAASGTTTFKFDPASGTVTRLSGTGVRLATTSERSLVTLQCGGQPACANFDTIVTVTRTGTPTGRAGPLANFTVSNAGTGTTIIGTPTTGDTLTFTVAAFGQKASTTVWIGFNMPITGNESGSATGTANASFVVTTSKANGSITSTLSAQATASVLRSLAISKTANLAFGRLTRPSSGSGTVSLSSSTDAVSVTGTNVRSLSVGTTTAAAFTITGEGGQAVSVTVPTSFTMTSGSGSIVVSTSPSASGSVVLGGSLGSGGSLPLKVGGSFNLSTSTPAQNYTGTFAVTVQYN